MRQQAESDYLLGTVANSGFEWQHFQRYFPFGNLAQREGEYVRLVEAVLDTLATARERTALLDLLDMQWAAFIEQTWVANELSLRDDVFAEPAFARVQINQNLREKYGATPRDVRGTLLGVRGDETLIGTLTSAPSPRAS